MARGPRAWHALPPDYEHHGPTRAGFVWDMTRVPTFQNTRTVAFSAAEMYALVADVERYPKFLPMCTGLRITSRKPTDTGEQIVATMSVGYKAIRESFTTRVDLQPAARRVDVAYLNGPFKRLDNRWQFTDLPEGGSTVDFYISYEFKSPLLGAIVGAVFDSAFRRFTEAFETRAREVYGAPGCGVAETV